LFVGINGESPAKFTPKNRTRSPFTTKCPFVSALTQFVPIGAFIPEKSVTTPLVASFQGKTHGTVCPQTPLGEIAPAPITPARNPTRQIRGRKQQSIMNQP
jgi:hypothetical protein